MPTAITGTFRNGRVELDRDPGIVGEAKVVVTFLQDENKHGGMPQSKMMTFGMLAVPGRSKSTDEDFKMAEYDDSGWDRD